MSIVEFDCEAPDDAESGRWNDTSAPGEGHTSGRTRPATREVLYDKGGGDLTPQNNALYWAHEAVSLLQLDRLTAACRSGMRQQVRDLEATLARADDLHFYECMCSDGEEFPFLLRYAWLFCRFADLDEDDVNTVFPVGYGFEEAWVGNCRVGMATCKQELADVLLVPGPFPYVERASNVVSVLETVARSWRQ